MQLDLGNLIHALEAENLELRLGAIGFSFSLPKKVMVDMSAVVVDSMVSRVQLPLQPFMKFFAALMPEVVLLVPTK